jgi:hypothetical protein
LQPNVEHWRPIVDADLDTLATALYVRVDDLLKTQPDRVPWRPRVGIAPKLADAELVTLCVMQALLGFTSEARWLRYARAHLRTLFPYLPQQPGYNKRLRKLVGTISWLIGVLGRDTSLFTDDVWIADSRPVECGRSRETAQRSDLAGFAEYGYCASRSRYFWGLRLHLLCTLGGLPVGAALTGAKADERLVLLDILTDPTLAGHRPGQTLIADKNYFGRDFEATLAQSGLHLLRPARKGRTRTTRRAILQTPAPGHRIDQRHLQRTTRPRSPRRPHPHRRHRPHLATRPRPHRRHLAQRPHRRTDQTIPDRLRPLTLESFI